MSHAYDDYRRVTCTTAIAEEKDGWYRFEDTVFYGDKGGMPADEGTINGQTVDGLRWQEETLWHHVEGAPLQNPIHMQVDWEKRLAHTVPQTALHILDSYYRRRNILITSTGCHENNEYYDIDTKNVTPEDLKEAEDYINEAIQKDAPVHFSYVRGADYPNPAYQKFDEVRIVTIEGLDEQPCGTPHVNHTGEISSFVILSMEKTAQGARIFFTSGPVTAWRLKEMYAKAHETAFIMGTGVEDMEEKARILVASNKAEKQQINDLIRQLMAYKAQEYAAREDKIFDLGPDAGTLRPLSQALLRIVSDTRILYAGQQPLDFAIVSKEGNARTLLDTLKQTIACSGGGSPQIVSGRTQVSREEFQKALTSLSL